MTSPIAIFLKNFRLRAGQTQVDFAHSLGYEQAYVSGIELGQKGPSKEFLAQLKKVFSLGASEIAELEDALRKSQRYFSLPAQASTDTYLFCNELWDRIETLHPAVLASMRELLKVEDQMSSRPRPAMRLVRQNRKREAQM